MLVLVVLVFGSVIGFNLFKQKMIGEYMANQPAPTFPVTTATVSPVDWIPSIDSIGFIEPYRGVTLKSEAAGLIETIDFESGEKVSADTLLLSLDTDVERANLKRSQASLPALKAQAHRMEVLLRQNSASEGQRDEAVANYEAQVADVAAQKATIARREIRAPFAGQIGIRQVFLGQYLEAGTEIVRLEDTSTMRIRFTIPQNQLSKIFVDQTIEVQVDAYPETSFHGKITTIEPAVNFQSGVVQVQADVPNENGVLRSGMFARVNVILPTLPQQLVIPQTAVNFTLYGETIFIAETREGDSQLIATQRTIKVEERRGDVARVSGLNPGETIVTSGQVRLSNGSQIKVVESDALNTPAEIPAL
ncbi:MULTISPECIES: efflux RND transporter periplasmic adaptor subunit [Corallincola]|uniref:Efflux RND transporter periplasmic adaptor subunit n=2 Tax=Corallincola TaxID=1775176 RepID=A0A368N7N2_9GAMM|nr:MULTISPECIES: efflux RND transporter periplasmic adaptor subunit [Corallincola]RCU45535.1 efflux RND transporter periplasmic adaptor subunit [Corallincola holothuriorum]TAA41015.1 efflux RND transporter periplasmic adaptor subunit [Corallincola spongiicola]